MKGAFSLLMMMAALTLKAALLRCLIAREQVRVKLRSWWNSTLSLPYSILRVIPKE
jgi:hypothetical protein